VLFFVVAANSVITVSEAASVVPDDNNKDNTRKTKSANGGAMTMTMTMMMMTNKKCTKLRKEITAIRGILEETEETTDQLRKELSGVRDELADEGCNVGGGLGSGPGNGGFGNRCGGTVDPPPSGGGSYETQCQNLLWGPAGEAAKRSMHCYAYGGQGDPCALNVQNDDKAGLNKDPSLCQNEVFYLWDEVRTRVAE